MALSTDHINYFKSLLAIDVFRQILIDFIGEQVHRIQQELLNIPAIGQVCSGGTHTTLDLHVHKFLEPCCNEDENNYNLAECSVNKWVEGLWEVHQDPIAEVDSRNFAADQWPLDPWQVALFFKGHSTVPGIGGPEYTCTEGLVEILHNCSRIRNLFTDIELESVSQVCNLGASMRESRLPEMTESATNKLLLAVVAVGEIPVLKSRTLQVYGESPITRVGLIREMSLDLAEQEKESGFLLGLLDQCSKRLQRAVTDHNMYSQEFLEEATRLTTFAVLTAEPLPPEHPLREQLGKQLGNIQNAMKYLRITRDLIEVYNENFKTTTLLPWLPSQRVDIAKVFVMPRLTKVTGCREGEINSNYCDDLETIDEIFEMSSGERHIIIEGPPGVGKRFLTHHLLSKWASPPAEHSVLHTYSLLLYISGSFGGDIYNYIEHELLPGHSKIQLKESLTKHPGKILVIVEHKGGMNENIYQAIREMLGGEILKKTTFVVTARPGTLSCKDPSTFTQLKMKGFPLHTQMNYVGRFFRNIANMDEESKQEESVLRILEEKGDKDLTSIPLNLYMMCVSATALQLSQLSTKTMLYKDFFYSCTQQADIQNPENTKFGEIISILEKSLYKSHKQSDKIAISIAQLMFDLSDTQNEDLFKSLSSLSFLYEDDHRDIGPVIEFSSQSFGEFLLAQHISQLPRHLKCEDVKLLLQKDLSNFHVAQLVFGLSSLDEGDDLPTLATLGVREFCSTWTWISRILRETIASIIPYSIPSRHSKDADVYPEKHVSESWTQKEVAHFISHGTYLLIDNLLAGDIDPENIPPAVEGSMLDALSRLMDTFTKDVTGKVSEEILDNWNYRESEWLPMLLSRVSFKNIETISLLSLSSAGNKIALSLLPKLTALRVIGLHIEPGFDEAAGNAISHLDSLENLCIDTTDIVTFINFYVSFTNVKKPTVTDLSLAIHKHVSTEADVNHMEWPSVRSFVVEIAKKDLFHDLEYILTNTAFPAMESFMVQFEKEHWTDCTVGEAWSELFNVSIATHMPMWMIHKAHGNNCEASGVLVAEAKRFNAVSLNDEVMQSTISSNTVVQFANKMYKMENMKFLSLQCSDLCLNVICREVTSESMPHLQELCVSCSKTGAASSLSVVLCHSHIEYLTIVTTDGSCSNAISNTILGGSLPILKKLSITCSGSGYSADIDNSLYFGDLVHLSFTVNSPDALKMCCNIIASGSFPALDRISMNISGNDNDEVVQKCLGSIQFNTKLPVWLVKEGDLMEDTDIILYTSFGDFEDKNLALKSCGMHNVYVEITENPVYLFSCFKLNILCSAYSVRRVCTLVSSSSHLESVSICCQGESHFQPRESKQILTHNNLKRIAFEANGYNTMEALLDILSSETTPSLEKLSLKCDICTTDMLKTVSWKLCSMEQLKCLTLLLSVPSDYQANVSSLGVILEALPNLEYLEVLCSSENVFREMVHTLNATPYTSLDKLKLVCTRTYSTANENNLIRPPKSMNMPTLKTLEVSVHFESLHNMCSIINNSTLPSMEIITIFCTDSDKITHSKSLIESSLLTHPKMKHLQLFAEGDNCLMALESILKSDCLPGLVSLRIQSSETCSKGAILRILSVISLFTQLQSLTFNVTPSASKELHDEKPRPLQRLALIQYLDLETSFDIVHLFLADLNTGHHCALRFIRLVVKDNDCDDQHQSLKPLDLVGLRKLVLHCDCSTDMSRLLSSFEPNSLPGLDMLMLKHHGKGSAKDKRIVEEAARVIYGLEKIKTVSTRLFQLMTALQILSKLPLKSNGVVEVVEPESEQIRIDDPNNYSEKQITESDINTIAVSKLKLMTTNQTDIHTMSSLFSGDKMTAITHFLWISQTRDLLETSTVELLAAGLERLSQLEHLALSIRSKQADFLLCEILRGRTSKSLKTVVVHDVKEEAVSQEIHEIRGNITDILPKTSLRSWYILYHSSYASVCHVMATTEIGYLMETCGSSIKRHKPTARHVLSKGLDSLEKKYHCSINVDSYSHFQVMCDILAVGLLPRMTNLEFKCRFSSMEKISSDSFSLAQALHGATKLKKVKISFMNMSQPKDFGALCEALQHHPGLEEVVLYQCQMPHTSYYTQLLPAVRARRIPLTYIEIIDECFVKGKGLALKTKLLERVASVHVGCESPQFFRLMSNSSILSE